MAKVAVGTRVLLLCVLLWAVAEVAEARPAEIGQSSWCEVCQAIVKNLKSRLGDKSASVGVAACKNGNFQGYQTSAYQLGRFCQDFLSDFEDDIVDGMTARKNNASIR